MGNDHLWCSHSNAPKWKIYECPRKDCKYAREQTGPGPCPKHSKSMMVLSKKQYRK